jgi:ubiquitin carboxyl-terminal hydrolase 8
MKKENSKEINKEKKEEFDKKEFLGQNDNPLCKSIKEEFHKHEPIGLINLGKSCYMNSTLQCLCNIDKLVSYFKYNQKIENFIQSHGNTTLTYSFKYLIENLWKSPGSKYILPKYNEEHSFSPRDFKDKISSMNHSFEENNFHDPKDLLKFIIMTLHKELNKKTNNSDLSNNNQKIDQTNHDMAFKFFVQNIIENFGSIISDIFFAISGYAMECLNCKTTKYHFHDYFFLSFPLEEVRKFKKQKLANSNNQNMMSMNPNQFQFQQNQFDDIYSINLDDCFQYNEKTEFFTGENAMYCSECDKVYNHNYSPKLYYGPEILIIILDRGRGMIYSVHLEFTEKIDLSQYFQMKNFGNVYNLIGVVSFLNGGQGHFISYVKSPIDGLWHNYNDCLVSKISDFKKQLEYWGTPYILFYQKEK